MDRSEAYDSHGFHPELHVSSLYGPGTIACWLFTVWSVLVTWVLNPPYRRNDRITGDLVAATSYPAILTGHMIYLVVQSHTDTSTDWSGSIGACLNVFDAFGAFLLLLFCLALSTSNRRRVAVLSLAFLFYLTSEITAGFRGPDAVLLPTRSDLSYLERIQIIVIIGFVISSLSYGGSFLYTAISKSGFPPKFNFQISGRRYLLQAREKLDQYFPRLRPLLGWLKAPLALLGIILTIALITALVSIDINFEDIQDDLKSILWAFIPHTNISLGTWDQAGALAGGALAFLYSLLCALRELSKDMTGPKEEAQPQAAIDLEAMWA